MHPLQFAHTVLTVKVVEYKFFFHYIFEWRLIPTTFIQSYRHIDNMSKSHRQQLTDSINNKALGNNHVQISYSTDSMPKCQKIIRYLETVTIIASILESGRSCPVMPVILETYRT